MSCFQGLCFGVSSFSTWDRRAYSDAYSQLFHLWLSSILWSKTWQAAYRLRGFLAHSVRDTVHCGWKRGCERSHCSRLRPCLSIPRGNGKQRKDNGSDQLAFFFILFVCSWGPHSRDQWQPHTRQTILPHLIFSGNNTLSFLNFMDHYLIIRIIMVSAQRNDHSPFETL